MSLIILVAPAAAFNEQEKAAIVARIDSLHAAGNPAIVHAALDSLLPLAQAEDDTSLIIALLLRRGHELATYGKGLQGEPVLREAAAMAEAYEDSVSLSIALRWLGVAIGNQGRFAEARDISSRLRNLATRIGHASNEAWALVGLGWVDEREGRAEDSVRSYLAAIDIFREITEPQGEIWALNGLGVAYHCTYENDAALAAYRRVVEVARAHGFTTAEGLAQNNLGIMQYGLGDPGLAMAHFQDSTRLLRSAQWPYDAIVAAHNTADCLTLLGRYDHALTLLDQLLRECRELGFSGLEIMLLNASAAIHVLQGRHQTAAAVYRKALALPPVGAPKHRVDSYSGLCDALAGLDSSATAVSILRDVLPQYMTSPPEEEWFGLEVSLGKRLLETEQYTKVIQRLVPLCHKAEEYRLGVFHIELASLVARAYRALQQPDSALTYLRDAAGAWEAVRELPRDPEWREQRGALGRLVYVQLAELLLTSDQQEHEHVRLQDAFHGLQAFKSRTLLERMLGPGRDLFAAESNDPITLIELQEQVLAEGELFLDAYVGPTGSLIFAVTRDVCRVVRAPAEEALRRRVVCYCDLLSTPAEAQTGLSSADARRAVARGLLTDLTAGVEDLLRTARRILVAPDGPLNLVPLAALYEDAAVVQEPGQREWVRVPSASILAHLRRRPPAISAAATSRGLAVAGSLAGAIREVEELRARYSNIACQVLADSTAGLSDETLHGYPLLHIAAHVRIDNQAPWQSEIEFYTQGSPKNLRAGQIAQMDLPARLVVLSSCESAGGRVLAGEGVLGLTSAFLSAGAAAVVATLWPVDDRTTVDFMLAFYGHLAAGEPVGSALESARQAVRRRRSTAHPFYWAGFTLVGDADLRFPLVSRSGWRRHGWAVLIPIALGGFALLLRRKQFRNRV